MQHPARQEIEDAIAYNNAPSSTLILKAPEGCVDFLSAGEKSCKVGYSIDNSKAAGVPQGNYYTTVVHFADGTVLMTDVKQK